MEFPKAYNPADYEDKIYRKWEESGLFNPDNLKLAKNARPFTIIMPPPNANGSLHLGHAVFVTLEDIMTRYHRMKGEAALWLPGADHAGFETQVVFEKKLEKEGKSRWDFPREELYKMMWNFTQTNKTAMENQLRRLGASCDWSRERFTLDPSIVKIVHRTFKKLYDDGLVYRGERLVSWCTKHQTTLSDLEVKHEDKETQLVYIKYPFKKSPGEFIVVATTRPETMLGDTAVAVNPKDKKYKKLIGQKVIVPLVGREIPIIADEAVELGFGTGMVKVTPAHDPVDFEIGERHDLEKIQVIDQKGRMTDAAGTAYAGMKVEEARAKVVADLETRGLIEKIEPYRHSVAVCYKCNRAIEPLVLPQWFVKMEPLAKKAMAAVKKGEVKFVTKRFEKVFFHWLKNIRDWNISRQIVWGIRMPVWYKKRTNEIYVGIIPPNDIENWDQETDVFDTWFSSGQWPFATLESTGDFKKFYPTAVMETGWDILFFWVARMIMLGLYATGRAPFKYVYLHGLVRDKDRQKMSKSKGNVIDPLGVVDLYGADALRMALVFGVSAGNDAVISEEKIKAHRNFANKIWNASRFVLSKLGNDFKPRSARKKSKNADDAAILKDLGQTTKKMTKYLDNFEFHLAAETVYQFFWHNFCDKYLEAVKNRLPGFGDEGKPSVDSADQEAARQVLYKVLVDSLKLLHPFMPYVTEVVYQELPKKEKDYLIAEEWPE